MCSGEWNLLRSGIASHGKPGYAAGSIAATAPKVSGYSKPRRKLPMPPIEMPVTTVFSRWRPTWNRPSNTV